MTDDRKDGSGETVRILFQRAGVKLTPEQFEGLSESLPHVERHLGTIRKGLKRFDEPALVFRAKPE
ncbi:MAG: hypothetical protein WD270_02385 [Acetobacterales bacterium]